MYKNFVFITIILLLQPNSTEPCQFPSPPSLPASCPPSLLDVKCREKDALIFNLAFELKQLAERNIWLRYPALVDNLRKHIAQCPDFNRVVLVQYLNGKLAVTPKVCKLYLLLLIT